MHSGTLPPYTHTQSCTLVTPPLPHVSALWVAADEAKLRCTVTTPMDGTTPVPHGSLRFCINMVNQGKFAAAEITFNVTDPGQQPVDAPVVIKLVAALPKIVRTVTIDGTSQPVRAGAGIHGTASAAAAWAPPITLDGSDAGSSASGIKVRASAADVVIKGLMLTTFGGNGVQSAGPRTRVGGVHVHACGSAGVYLLESAVGAVIGDPTQGERGRVVLTANEAGIVSLAPLTKFANVYIGVTADGLRAAGNLNDGFVIESSAVGTMIGDAAAGRDG